MAVGFLDWDLTYWQQPIIFNLELMKLAAYHKKKRNIVQMLHQYDNIRYSTIIVRKDYDDDYYPKEVFGNPKTESGGLALSSGKYSAMDLEIEKMVPDISIYQKMSKYYQSSKQAKYLYKTMFNSPHVRLSLDGTTIWKDWRSQLRGVNFYKSFHLIVHDKDITKINDAPQVIAEQVKLHHHLGRRVGFKYPLDIYNIDQFISWGTLKKVSHMSIMRLHTIFEDKAFYEVINDGGNMECSYSLKDISNDTLCQIYKQMMFLRDHRSRLLLILENPKWVQVGELISEYSSYCYNNNAKIEMTLYEYAKRICKWLKVDLINTFDFVRLNNYPLFKLFYECSSVEFQDENFKSRWEWKANGGTIL